MNVQASPDDRLTAFGNQLTETHLRLREDLARLREGALPPHDLRTRGRYWTSCAATTS